MYNIKKYESFLDALNEEYSRVEVTKEMWDSWGETEEGYEKRMEALLTVFKDPSDAETWVETKWEYLPGQASHMTIDTDTAVNEEVNTDIVNAKLKITELREEIASEVSKQKEAESLEDKAKAIDQQANLYQRMPGLLRDLAAKMKAKASAGDSSNIY